MSQPMIRLVCPTCKRTCRTGRETRPGAKMRCPRCDGVFSSVVHGNGVVELRPVGDKPATEPRLPPHVGGQGETQVQRRIITSRRRNRLIGGYAPVEKSRAYIGMLALWTILGLGSLATSWYLKHIDIITEATGRTGANPWQSQDEAKRKDFQARQKRALEELKKQATKVPVQPATAKVEDRRQPGDQILPD